ncbi:hypothetical protein [Sphingomonas radiodurans]|uniref:hypothetical protein n=1 Tax=Sphingomonas radiodurans TaxID=2890321 RepID=UPI001E4B4AE0|nr:hypothetical protein [Sphingomonas radiodurans]WBH16450.1 hypothetical protein LLW23_16940 [Sphingomonas radiodurans]
MTKIYAALLGSAIMFATPAVAQSVFNGTWKGDPKSGVLEAKPDKYVLKGNTYSCETCIPAYSTIADGAFHAVADRPYWDEIAIKTVDPRTVTFQFRKDGKIIGENKRVVSADGKSTTVSASNTNNAAGTKVEQSTVQRRVGAPVAGAHLISGEWRTDEKTTNVTDNALLLTLKVEGDTLRLTSPMGETLDATFGGDYAPNVGDPGKTMTKAALLAANKLELTDMRDGKVVQVTTYTVSPDGRTLDASWSDPRDGSKGTYKATKQ